MPFFSRDSEGAKHIGNYEKWFSGNCFCNSSVSADIFGPVNWMWLNARPASFCASVSSPSIQLTVAARRRTQVLLPLDVLNRTVRTTDRAIRIASESNRTIWNSETAGRQCKNKICGPWGQRGKSFENAVFRGKRHDNNILKVQILLSRNFVVIAQAPRNLSQIHHIRIYCYPVLWPLPPLSL